MNEDDKKVVVFPGATVKPVLPVVLEGGGPQIEQKMLAAIATATTFLIENAADVDYFVMAVGKRTGDGGVRVKEFISPITMPDFAFAIQSLNHTFHATMNEVDVSEDGP